jgi:hypothetical protein
MVQVPKKPGTTRWHSPSTHAGSLLQPHTGAQFGHRSGVACAAIRSAAAAFTLVSGAEQAQGSRGAMTHSSSRVHARSAALTLKEPGRTFAQDETNTPNSPAASRRTRCSRVRIIAGTRTQVHRRRTRRHSDSVPVEQRVVATSLPLHRQVAEIRGIPHKDQPGRQVALRWFFSIRDHRGECSYRRETFRSP